jgi:hypothetical protein
LVFARQYDSGVILISVLDRQLTVPAGWPIAWFETIRRTVGEGIYLARTYVLDPVESKTSGNLRSSRLWVSEARLTHILLTSRDMSVQG